MPLKKLYWALIKNNLRYMKKSILLVFSICAFLSFCVTAISLRSYNKYDEIVSSAESLAQPETTYPYQVLTYCSIWQLSLGCSSVGVDPCIYPCE